MVWANAMQPSPLTEGTLASDQSPLHPLVPLPILPTDADINRGHANAVVMVHQHPSPTSQKQQPMQPMQPVLVPISMTHPASPDAILPHADVPFEPYVQYQSAWPHQLAYTACTAHTAVLPANHFSSPQSARAAWQPADNNTAADSGYSSASSRSPAVTRTPRASARLSNIRTAPPSPIELLHAELMGTPPPRPGSQSPYSKPCGFVPHGTPSENLDQFHPHSNHAQHMAHATGVGDDVCNALAHTRPSPTLDPSSANRNTSARSLQHQLNHAAHNTTTLAQACGAAAQTAGSCEDMVLCGLSAGSGEDGHGHLAGRWSVSSGGSLGGGSREGGEEDSREGDSLEGGSREGGEEGSREGGSLEGGSRKSEEEGSVVATSDSAQQSYASLSDAGQGGAARRGLRLPSSDSMQLSHRAEISQDGTAGSEPSDNRPVWVASAGSARAGQDEEEAASQSRAHLLQQLGSAFAELQALIHKRLDPSPEIATQRHPVGHSNSDMEAGSHAVARGQPSFRWSEDAQRHPVAGGQGGRQSLEHMQRSSLLLAEASPHRRLSGSGRHSSGVSGDGSDTGSSGRCSGDGSGSGGRWQGSQSGDGSGGQSGSDSGSDDSMACLSPVRRHSGAQSAPATACSCTMLPLPEQDLPSLPGIMSPQEVPTLVSRVPSENMSPRILWETAAPQEGAEDWLLEHSTAPVGQGLALQHTEPLPTAASRSAPETLVAPSDSPILFVAGQESTSELSAELSQQSRDPQGLPEAQGQGSLGVAAQHGCGPTRTWDNPVFRTSPPHRDTVSDLGAAAELPAGWQGLDCGPVQGTVEPVSQESHCSTQQDQIRAAPMQLVCNISSSSHQGSVHAECDAGSDGGQQGAGQEVWSELKDGSQGSRPALESQGSLQTPVDPRTRCSAALMLLPDPAACAVSSSQGVKDELPAWGAPGRAASVVLAADASEHAVRSQATPPSRVARRLVSALETPGCFRALHTSSTSGAWSARAATAAGHGMLTPNSSLLQDNGLGTATQGLLVGSTNIRPPKTGVAGVSRTHSTVSHAPALLDALRADRPRGYVSTSVSGALPRPARAPVQVSGQPHHHTAPSASSLILSAEASTSGTPVFRSSSPADQHCQHTTAWTTQPRLNINPPATGRCQPVGGAVSPLLATTTAPGVASDLGRAVHRLPAGNGTVGAPRTHWRCVQEQQDQQAGEAVAAVALLLEQGNGLDSVLHTPASDTEREELSRLQQLVDSRQVLSPQERIDVWAQIEALLAARLRGSSHGTRAAGKASAEQTMSSQQGTPAQHTTALRGAHIAADPHLPLKLPPQPLNDLPPVQPSAQRADKTIAALHQVVAPNRTLALAMDLEWRGLMRSSQGSQQEVQQQ